MSSDSEVLQTEPESFNEQAGEVSAFAITSQPLESPNAKGTLLK